MFSKDTPQLQVATLPEGYSIITQGKVQPGDIRWSAWEDAWMLDSPLTEERHKIVMGAPVTGFHGICRKTGSDAIFQPAENRVKVNRSDRSTEYVSLEA